MAHELPTWWPYLSSPRWAPNPALLSIHASGLTKRFGEQLALEGLTLDVAAGEDSALL
jgi:hypothetical protein